MKKTAFSFIVCRSDLRVPSPFAVNKQKNIDELIEQSTAESENPFARIDLPSEINTGYSIIMSAEFKSSDFTISLQKKVLGKLANKTVIKKFLDENEAKLLDNVQKSIKLFITEAKANGWKVDQNAEKAVKNLIKVSLLTSGLHFLSLITYLIIPKIIIKLSVLTLNHQFDATEKTAAYQLQQSLRSTFMTIVSFHEVDFTYDRKFLIESFEEHRKQMKGLIAKHLSDKSGERIDNFIDTFANPSYLDFLYGTLKSTGNAKANDEILTIRGEMISGFQGLLGWFHL